MKQFNFLIVFLFLCGIASAQEELSKEEKERREKNIQAANPFAQFGYKGKVATLSKGKYLEVHDLDSIVTIGSIRFHVDRKEIVGVIQEENPNNEYARPIGDLPSRWLSIDPLAEEFPEWSPYNFSFNSPLKFNDPTGMGPEDVIITGVLKDKAFDQLKSSTQNLTLSMDNNGKVTAVANEGATLTEAEQTFLNATTSDKVTVNLNATDQNVMEGGKVLIGGSFDGTKKIDGVVQAYQTVNPNQMDIIDSFTDRGSGIGTLHETLESFLAGSKFPNSKAAVDGKSNKAYEYAHPEARRIDPRHKELTGTSPNDRMPYVLPNGDGTFQLEKYIEYNGQRRRLFTEKAYRP